MHPLTASSLRHRTVPGNPQQTNRALSLKPNLHQQVQNTSTFLIISMTSVDTGCTPEFYILIHVYKNLSWVLRACYKKWLIK